jgi:hypothetical protein
VFHIYLVRACAQELRAEMNETKKEVQMLRTTLAPLTNATVISSPARAVTEKQGEQACAYVDVNGSIAWWGSGVADWKEGRWTESTGWQAPHLSQPPRFLNVRARLFLLDLFASQVKSSSRLRGAPHPRPPPQLQLFLRSPRTRTRTRMS